MSTDLLLEKVRSCRNIPSIYEIGDVRGGDTTLDIYYKNAITISQ